MNFRLKSLLFKDMEKKLSRQLNFNSVKHVSSTNLFNQIDMELDTFTRLSREIEISIEDEQLKEEREILEKE